MQRQEGRSRVKEKLRGMQNSDKVKLAVGAAGLFLFVVGLKRTFRTDDGLEIRSNQREPEPPPQAAR